MDQTAREYELVLMLDPGLEDAARDKLAQEARAQIESEGTLKHENAWGLRKLAYEISQRTEADYRWYRFEAPRELLGRLDHNLKIADGVLRFRIFKVDPEAPVIEAPPSGFALAPARGGDRGDRGPRGEDRGPRREDRGPAAETPVAAEEPAE
ncbi:MAG TPA: 30S ribosomal protein S6 [Solirubrobacterales bacterium]|nr:30S ribosomal protein S6 [Solirubrobacterales bacterium]